MGWERGRVVVFIMGKVGALEQVRPGQGKKAGRKTKDADVGSQRRVPESEQEEEKGRPKNGGNRFPVRKGLPLPKC